MKEFIKELKIKKMKANDIAYLIAENQDKLIDFYVKSGHRAKAQDTVNDLFDKMMNPKFVKAVGKVAKDKENGGINTGFVVIINGLIEKNYKNENLTEEIVTGYSEIINKVLKSRIKEISKKVDIDKDIIKELLVIVPTPECVSNEKFTGIYSQKMLRKLYIMAGEKDLGITNTKDIKKMFSGIFGKKLLDLISINILLEKRGFMKDFNENQLAVWNIFTDFALEYIDSEDKKHIAELLEYYCQRRKNDDDKGHDAARRIALNNIDSEKYSTFAKAVKKFVENGKESMTKYI